MIELYLTRRPDLEPTWRTVATLSSEQYETEYTLTKTEFGAREIAILFLSFEKQLRDLKRKQHRDEKE